jgi:hypothetical protein
VIHGRTQSPNTEGIFLDENRPLNDHIFIVWLFKRLAFDADLAKPLGLSGQRKPLRDVVAGIRRKYKWREGETAKEGSRFFSG